MKHNDIITCFLRAYRLLTPKDRKRFYTAIAITVSNVLLETALLGLIALYAAFFASPGSFETLAPVKYLKIILPALDFSDHRQLLFTLSCVLVIAVVIKNAIKTGANFLIARYNSHLNAYFGYLILKSFFQESQIWHTRQNSSDLLSLLNWRSALGSGTIGASLRIMSNALLATFSLLLLLLLDVKVTLLIICIMGMLCIPIFNLSKKKVQRYSKELRDRNMALSRSGLMMLQGIKDIKIFQKESFFLNKFTQHLHQYARHDSITTLLISVPATILETVALGLLAGTTIFLIQISEFSIDEISSTLAVIAVVTWKTLPTISNILSEITAQNRSVPTTKKVLNILRSNIQEEPQNAQAPLPPFKDTLKLEELSFSYIPGSKVLHDISLTLKRNRFYGIIGTSGAGKSSLANLIAGLLHQDEGNISVDGHTLTPDTLPHWLSQIGYVPQSPYLLDGTLAENIAFGVPEADINYDRVRKALEMAAVDFIDKLPNGINEPLGEHADNLSGGQKQRIAIARALYTAPKILIFDEATSSLDSASENAIRSSLRSLKHQVTIIMIAHRLTTLGDCDEIVWLKKGRIVKFGTPNDVLPVYKDFLEHKQNQDNHPNQEVKDVH